MAPATASSRLAAFAIAVHCERRDPSALVVSLPLTLQDRRRPLAWFRHDFPRSMPAWVHHQNKKRRL